MEQTPVIDQSVIELNRKLDLLDDTGRLLDRRSTTTAAPPARVARTAK